MPRSGNYVDNAQNRRLGRVGMSYGSMVESSISSPCSSKTYVDNSYNRGLGRVGLPHGTMVVSKYGSSSPDFTPSSYSYSSSGRQKESSIYSKSYSSRPTVDEYIPNFDKTNAAQELQTKFYADNYMNQKLDRVDKPLGSAPFSPGEQKLCKQYYTDNDMNERLGRTGELRGSMPLSSEHKDGWYLKRYEDNPLNRQLDRVGQVIGSSVLSYDDDHKYDSHRQLMPENKPLGSKHKDVRNDHKHPDYLEQLQRREREQEMLEQIMMKKEHDRYRYWKQNEQDKQEIEVAQELSQRQYENRLLEEKRKRRQQELQEQQFRLAQQQQEHQIKEEEWQLHLGQLEEQQWQLEQLGEHQLKREQEQQWQLEQLGEHQIKREKEEQELKTALELSKIEYEEKERQEQIRIQKQELQREQQTILKELEEHELKKELEDLEEALEISKREFKNKTKEQKSQKQVLQEEEDYKLALALAADIPKQDHAGPGSARSQGLLNPRPNKQNGPVRNIMSAPWEITREKHRPDNGGDRKSQKATLDILSYPKSAPCTLKEEYQNNIKKITLEEAYNIEKSTREQAGCREWFDVRNSRITASNFHRIYKRRAMVTKAFIENLLHPKPFTSAATTYGKNCEPKAKDRYHRKTGINVYDCGFVVNPSYPFIGATPDGKICDDEGEGIIEIKCPYSMKDKTIDEVCANTAYCLKSTRDGHELKDSHDYYVQIQGQLLVTGAAFCDFVVYTEVDTHIERIYPDYAFMQNLLDKLSDFYFDYIKPEIRESEY